MDKFEQIDQLESYSQAAGLVTLFLYWSFNMEKDKVSKTDFSGPVISEYCGPAITEITGPKFRIIFGGRWAKFSSDQTCRLRLKNGGNWANIDFDFASHWTSPSSGNWQELLKTEVDGPKSSSIRS